MPTRLLPPVLILAVGNDLRGDDAAGWQVAETVAGWHHSGVAVICTRQLVPELADAVARAATVVLIDAQVSGSDTPSLSSTYPEPGACSLTHATSLSELLALARDLYGHAPPAWTLGIPSMSFEFGTVPSPRCRSGIEAALHLLTAVLPGE